jgi:signal transduction histidine kinase
MKHSVSRDLRNVRVRITAVTTLALVVILGAAGFVLINLFERELMREVDARLVGASDRVAQLGAIDVPLPPMGTPQDLVQVVDNEGDVVYSSATLQTEPAMWTPDDGERKPRTVQTNSEGPLRVRAVPFQDRWVIIADSLQPVQEAAQTLQKAMLIGLPPLALVLAILVWAVVGRTLRPVAAAVEHEEQLVADVSHELRSPLAGLRVLLETEPNQPQEIALSRIETIATLSRLETITDQLLVLTRQDQSPGPTTSHPVDLDEIVLHEVQALAYRSSVRIDTAEVEAGQVLGHEADLVELVENLLANAIRHARTAVRVSLSEHASTVELAVDDDGPGIDLGDRVRIFERFTRLDEARSRDRGGAGLGLAIVRAIVDVHGGSIIVDDSILGGARFIVRLPASTPSDPSEGVVVATVPDPGQAPGARPDLHKPQPPG